MQKAIDDDSADEVFMLLKEVGLLRLERERERGGVSLPLPEQEVDVSDAGWSLVYRDVLPVENWNAQISLLTGMGAAEVMLYGEVGVVRTLPDPPDFAVDRLRRTAAGLHLEWHPNVDYPDFVRSLDPNTPAGAAMLNACTTLLRGAGYVAFDGGVPEHIEHAALANEYAHVTAPLRRLVDRYAGEVAVALCADRDIPDWVRWRLRDLPKEMEASDRRAHQYERAVLDLVEAGLLSRRVGETFTGVVTDIDEKDKTEGVLVIQEPAVEAKVVSLSGALPLGAEVTATLAEADPTVQDALRARLTASGASPPMRGTEPNGRWLRRPRAAIKEIPIERALTWTTQFPVAGPRLPWCSRRCSVLRPASLSRPIRSPTRAMADQTAGQPPRPTAGAPRWVVAGARPVTRWTT